MRAGNKCIRKHICAGSGGMHDAVSQQVHYSMRPEEAAMWDVQETGRVVKSLNFSWVDVPFTPKQLGHLERGGGVASWGNSVLLLVLWMPTSVWQGVRQTPSFFLLSAQRFGDGGAGNDLANSPGETWAAPRRTNTASTPALNTTAAADSGWTARRISGFF